MRDRTKLALAKALQELLHTKTLDDVRVSELCMRCNLQRQSFYYHFQDKYDLVAWIFMQDTSRGFAESGNRLSVECITTVLRSFYEKKEFYVRIMADRSQNLPLLYIQDYVYRFCADLYREGDQADVLPMKLRVRLKFLVYGSMGVAWEWLNDQHAITAEELAQWMFEMVPPEMMN